MLLAENLILSLALEAARVLAPVALPPAVVISQEATARVAGELGRVNEKAVSLALGESFRIAGIRFFYGAMQPERHFGYAAGNPKPGKFLIAFERIRQALEKYPAGFFKGRNLRIVLVSDIAKQGPCGTFEANGVSLTDRGIAYFWTEAPDTTLHHELQHLVQAQAGMSEDALAAWERLSPPDTYLYTKPDRSCKFQERAISAANIKGFANGYGRLTPDEDRATIAGFLFTRGGARQLLDQAANDPVLLEKIQMTTGAEYDVKSASFVRTFSPEEYGQRYGTATYALYPAWHSHDGVPTMDAAYWNTLVGPQKSKARKTRK